MNLLIVGATGGTGRELVRQALDRGHVVTALVRTPAKMRDSHPNLRVVQGNVLDRASVDQAVKGQEAVLSALGHKRWLWRTTILSEGTRNIMQAMERHGVRRLVCETSLGIGDSWGRLGIFYTLFLIPLLLHFYFWDKWKQEKAIKESGVNWTIVRPAVLTNGQKKGSYRHGRDVGNWILTLRISRADVADFMLNQITDQTYIRKSPGVAY